MIAFFTKNHSVSLKLIIITCVDSHMLGLSNDTLIVCFGYVYAMNVTCMQCQDVWVRMMRTCLRHVSDEML